ncbi:AMP-dependent synthetase [Afipia sp. P52-10]|uniref:acyl-CoA synthetase n=1 Tax=Afipia sp. P52-10 TaxID=1429916 RepID=UPI0003DF30D1|nr:acyl-CoA synthetase [Afipia sp. P52-10]ETR78655.1 AMP-dependent synthetase [Afipia sp. P52-10]
MLTETDDYDRLYRDFRWDIPEHFNIGTACVDAHADGSGKLALIDVAADGSAQRYSFDDLKALSGRFANVLQADGLVRGDRVGVFLAQSMELPVVHLAAFRSGLVSVPLFTLFGEDALEFRLIDSAAKVVVTDAEGFEKLARIRDRLPALTRIYVTGARVPDGAASFRQAIEKASAAFTPALTRAEDPAIIVYTSGTTGNPKGALHAHRLLLGHLPSIQMCHDFFPKPDDLYWTPADWAWLGGLFDALFPAWYFGVPIVASRARKFEPQAAVRLMAEHKVRNVFFPPTALKLMRQANVTAEGVKLRSIISGGESLGAELVDWVRATFGIDANEIYGQTECNIAVGNCPRLFPIRPGSMGRPVPGFDVRILDEKGREVADGDTGSIGIHRSAAATLLAYWNNPDATRAKFVGDYLMTGDLGRRDADGYFWYVSRDDDIITSAGYRIGPSEIENTLIKHPAVAIAAVVGIPDPIRTEAIKAWIVLRPGFAASDDLAREIQAFVRVQLSAHEYPRYVAFTDSLPMTATSKVIRRALRARG